MQQVSSSCFCTCALTLVLLDGRLFELIMKVASKGGAARGSYRKNCMTDGSMRMLRLWGNGFQVQGPAALLAAQYLRISGKARKLDE